MAAQHHQVALFLINFKQIATKNFQFIPRSKSMEAIARLGITVAQAKTILMGLTAIDFYRGPIEDGNNEGEQYWEFGKEIDGEDYFIRLKILANLDLALCHSFHVCEQPIIYPFKTGGVK